MGQEVIDAEEADRATELAKVPRITDLDEIFAQGAESKSFFDAVSLLLGAGIKSGDVYQLLQLTDLKTREIDIIADGLILAKYGIGIDENPNEDLDHWEIPSLKNRIIFIMLGRISNKRESRKEFAEAIKQFKMKLESQSKHPLVSNI